MTQKRVQRWEDIQQLWRGPSYREEALHYHPSVEEAAVGGPLMTCVEVVDWDGDGGRDLLLSGWDACYGSELRVHRQVGVHPNGTPRLAEAEIVPGVTGSVTAVPDGQRLHLLSTSRLRGDLWLYRDEARSGPPRFGAPLVLSLEADWLHAEDEEDEILYLARFADVDGDGRRELLVGTDYWGDYWPDGKEWFEKGYRPYDETGRWLGGPLHGHVYVFENHGTPAEPRLGRGRAVVAGDRPLDVYGMAAPAVGALRGPGTRDLVCGDFLRHLHVLPGRGGARFDSSRRLHSTAGEELTLSHCIHVPAPVDWDGDGRVDLLVGTEGGRVLFLRSTGEPHGEVPAVEAPRLVRAAAGPLHGGAMPVPATWDWSGDGRLDLITGNTEGELIFYANLGTAESPAFAQGVRLRAGGVPVRVDAPGGSLQGPSEVRFGYTCPTVVDWNGDGLPQVLMSDVRGRHLLLKSAGGSPPELEAPRPLLFEGKPLVTVWRVRPSVVSWKDDGALDYVCLDEDGVLTSYTRESEDRLGSRTPLLFEDGAPVQFTEDFGGGRGRIKLCLCKWTGDGRYHLIYGTHNRASVPPGPAGAPRHTTGQAGVFLMENVGTNGAPRFRAPRPLSFRGAPIALGMHACAPEAVSWTGGPELDLLVGAEDGTLIWFRRKDLSW
jgi:hypothetical protein